MKGFHNNLEKETVENSDFRRVLYTGKHSQLVLMSLRPNEEIELEMHDDTDQFFRCEQGQGKCVIDDNEYELSDGVSIIVPEGANHTIINTSATDDLKLYTVYSPPHHKDGVAFATKAAADASSEEFDGVTSE